MKLRLQPVQAVTFVLLSFASVKTAHANHTTEAKGEQIIVSPGLYLRYGVGGGGSATLSVGAEVSCMRYANPWWNLDKGDVGLGASLQLGWSVLLSKAPASSDPNRDVWMKRPYSEQWFRIAIAGQSTIPRFILGGGAAGLAYEHGLTSSAGNSFAIEATTYLTFGFDSVGMHLSLPLHHTLRGPQIAAEGSIKVPFSVKGYGAYQFPLFGGGRPLWIGGERRLARLQRCSLEQRTGSRRKRISNKQRWRDDLRAEHASIPAFAYLALDLLRLGAPLELIKRAQQAAHDEIQHTKGCAREANVKLDRLTAISTWDRPICDARLLVVETLLDGCLGEGEAVVRARLRSSRTRTPRAKRLLRQIVAEESAHRELAFDVIEHLCLQDPKLVAVVRDALELAIVMATTQASLGVVEATQLRIQNLTARYTPNHIQTSV